MTELIQLYRWTRPKEKIETIGGAIPAGYWMQMECNRINANPERVAEIRRNMSGKMAVFVNDVSGGPGPKHSKLPKTV